MKESTAVVNWLRREVKAKNTPFLIFCGRQRSGKTAFAMRVAWEVWPETFTYDNVVNTVEDWAKRMNEVRNSCIILDEATASLYVYDWYAQLHKIFNILNDSQAYLHNAVFLVLPKVSLLTSQQKERADAVITMMKHKAWDDALNKRIYKYYYRYKVQIHQYDNMNKKQIYMRTIKDECGPVPLPPPHIWNPYIDVGQQEYKEKILKEQLAEISKITKSKEKITTVV